MAGQFDEKVALVTGGSSGIGRSASLAFAREGAAVVVAARRTEEGEETAELIKKAGGQATFIQTDVSEAAQVQALVEGTLQRFDRLDFAFNNAGIEGTPFVSIEDDTEENWDAVIDINLKGVWLCLKHQIPALLNQPDSAIVNMSSVAGLKGGTLGAPYYASKHGVIGLTRAAAMEYADRGLRVNAVCPAVIVTPMADRAFFSDPEQEARVKGMHPLGRLGTPDEVADAVVWLCSDSSSFVTGHALPIDGGLVV